MYLVQEIKNKINKIYDLIAYKFSLNKPDLTAQEIKTNKPNKQYTKLNRFGFPKDIEKNELNKPK